MSGQGLPDEALAHACKGEDDEDPALDEDGRQRLLVAHLQQQTYCPLPASCDSSAALAESVSKVVRPHRMLGILEKHVCAMCTSRIHTSIVMYGMYIMSCDKQGGNAN